MYSRIFKSPGWHQANIAVLKEQCEELLFVSWKGLSLPFIIQAFEYDGNVFRLARFATIISSDYLDFPEIESVDNLLFELLELKLQEKNIAGLLLSNIRSHSAIHRLIHHHFKLTTDIDCLPSLGVVCPEGSVEDYFKTIGKSSARNLRRISKKCKVANFKLDYRPLKQQDLNWLLFHQDKRADRMAYDSINHTLIPKILKQQLGDPHLYFACIQQNGILISGMLAFDVQGTIGIYLQAFDEAYEHFYPSIFLLTELIAYATRNEYSYIDLLRGEEVYKTRFCNHSIPLVKTLAHIDPKVNWDGMVKLAKSLIE